MTYQFEVDVIFLHSDQALVDLPMEIFWAIHILKFENEF